MISVTRLCFFIDCSLKYVCAPKVTFTEPQKREEENRDLIVCIDVSIQHFDFMFVCPLNNTTHENARENAFQQRKHLKNPNIYVTARYKRGV